MLDPVHGDYYPRAGANMGKGTLAKAKTQAYGR